MRYIGKPVERVDGRAKVKGEALFAADMDLPGQAYMKMLMARRPHAIVRRVDTRRAEALAGVLGVLTARDVPCNEFGYYTPDQPVLCGLSAKPYTERVRYVGDRVAAVMAESEAIAARAVELIEVEYEDLPVVTDMEAALAPGAPLLHPELGTNLFGQHILRNGDLEEGFRQAEVIVESVYNTPAQEHAYLQTEAGLAYIDEQGRVAVITTGQWGAKDRKQMAHALGLPEERVRVIYPMTGGAFGGREDISVQIIVALAALKLQRPVKVVWTREESIIAHCKRHPFRVYTRWGATREGKIVAAEVKLLADGGAYKFTTSIVTGNAVINCLGPYEIPNVKVDTFDIYTNNVPRGAFRGFGGPQGAYVAEMQVAKLAEALGMDPVGLRMRNLAGEGSRQTTGAPFPPGVTIRQTTEACARAAGWELAAGGWSGPQPAALAEGGEVRRGVGLACAHKNVGFSFGYPESCTVGIELHGGEQVERAVIRHGASEVGMGAHTAITQMAADALGVGMEQIELVSSDTAQIAGDSGAVSASRMTFFVGNAIKDGAVIALQRWQDEDRPVRLEHTYYPPKTTAPDPLTGQCDPNVAYAYTAQAAEVQVDLETGQVDVLKVVCAIDVGKAINPQQVLGQVQGGLVQSLGYTVLENFIEKDGRVLTPSLSTYLVPTVLDIPAEMEIIILENPDPRGPWGARGLGEVMNMCLAPAITAAVHAASGVWFDEFPLTPERVLRGLGKI